MPSQQNSRQVRDELNSKDYLSALPINNNSSKVENYKRIKQEEAAARAKLIAPRLEAVVQGLPQYHSDLKKASGHQRNPNLLGMKYKPSENAFAQYSPLRNELSHQ